MRRRIVSASVIAVAGLFALLSVGLSGVGASAASAASADSTDAQPTLAQTGYDFTPMLVTAAVVLVIAGITVILAKYVLTRSSHS